MGVQQPPAVPQQQQFVQQPALVPVLQQQPGQQQQLQQQQQVPAQQPLQMVQQQPLAQQIPQQRVLQEPVVQSLQAQAVPKVQQDNVADYEAVPNRDNMVKETVDSDKVPGRDLKENSRNKRDTLCENNPDCDVKFNRDPVKDYIRDTNEVAILPGRELLSQNTGDSDVEP